MKVLSLFAGLALGASLMLASSALASDHGNLQLFDKVILNGKQLHPGQYRVEWTGTNQSAEVKILHDGRLLAETPAKIVTATAQNNDGYMTFKTKSGKQDLTGIFFGGKDWTLQLKQPSSMKTVRNMKTSG
jgi:predicted extracellular nuclease